LFSLPQIKKQKLNMVLVISFTGIFLTSALSYFNSEDKLAYWALMKNKLPFLFIPVTIAISESISQQQFKILRYIFIACCILSSSWTFLQYLQDVSLYQRLYTQGQVLPTLIHHVSFAVLLCIGVLFAVKNLFSSLSKGGRIINILILLWLIYFIHLLSVRTGIVLLYIGLFGFFAGNLISRKHLLYSLLLLVLALSAGYLSYLKIPTLRSKIEYTFYGYGQYREQKDTLNQLSDPRRFLSDQVGFELFRKNKIWGTGTGDLQHDMNQLYKARYPQFSQGVYAHIHNQYLYSLTGLGIFLGSLFCICLFIPLLHFIRNKDLIFSIAYLMLLLVMLWEPLIENQLGTSIYLFVCCLGFIRKKE
jgi:O-antigen ligase